MKEQKTRKIARDFEFVHNVKYYENVNFEPDTNIKIETKIFGYLDTFADNGESESDKRRIGTATAFCYDFGRLSLFGYFPYMVASGYIDAVKMDFCRFITNEITGHYNERFIEMMKKKFNILENYDADDMLYSVGRILMVYEHRTFSAYRGSKVTESYYNNLDTIFRPDLIVVNPFPLQFEGVNNGESPKNDEFGVDFKTAKKKVRSLCQKAGMKPLCDGWMGMLGSGFKG